ncbi:unnamed protein product [Ranitomeya imitator]|uniref:Chromo domain-containing protein n=1 Tax=Ranitomeya imitator TaxID=111125 RepID=A0ABN9MI08_9NEOB|nr:unnamed protein product [Ranitomeya imitator]
MLKVKKQKELRRKRERKEESKEMNIQIKLGQKFIGPFKISGITSSVACRLKLPRTMKGLIALPPEPVLVDGQKQFIVKEIPDSRNRRNQLQYLIKWQGYSSENSWEPSP